MNNLSQKNAQIQEFALNGQVATRQNQNNSQKQQIKEQIKKQLIDLKYEEQQTPQHFYDSDIASVNQKDFQSDNQPPKDIVYQRKLLFKQKLLHVYKTIISIGFGIDKPAKYDKISLKWKPLQTNDSKNQVKLSLQQANQILKKQEQITYNLGMQNEDIERMATSMRPKQISLFEVQQLQIGQKNSVKLLKQRTSILIEVRQWTTVIDIQGNKKYLKYILSKGNGPHRVSMHDQISFKYSVSHLNKKYEVEHKDLRMQKQEIQKLPKIIWKMLTSMKRQQISEVSLAEEFLFQLEQQQEVKKLNNLLVQDIKEQVTNSQNQQVWKFKIQIIDFNKIDDVDLNGGLLKKVIIKGVSTAKPDASSIIYFGLKFLGPDNEVLKQDPCFNSDWWQDYGKLDILGCRKIFLDQWKISKALKRVFYRMKPAQIAQMQIRDFSLFQYGQDYGQFKQLYEQKGLQFPPKSLRLIIRVYNFTQGLTCFNMQLQQKVKQSKRKKIIALKIFQQKNYQKALRRFQNIVSFYAQGKINQEGYNQKISALMNSILCHLKLNQYKEMIPLCNQVLKKPKHGAEISDITIHGPQNVKIQNKDPQEKKRKKSQTKTEEGDQSQGNKKFTYQKQENQKDDDIGVQVNQKIIDKCLFRKATALTKIGDHQQALEALDKISDQTEDVELLRKDVKKAIVQYVKKSKQIFKSMFSAFG